MSYCKTTIVSIVGRDPEMRYLPSGDPVTNFSVPYDVGYGDSKSTQWVDCSVWGKRAESANEYLKKGSGVVVSGTLKLEEFTKRDGSPGAKLSMRVDEWAFAGAKPKGSEE